MSVIVKWIFAGAWAALAVALSAAAPALERLATAKSELIDPIWAEYDPASAEVVDHGPWDAFLKTYVMTGPDGVNRVAYADVTPDDLARLDRYLAAVQSVDPTTLNRNEQLAFWTNLYNARTVRLILEQYPVKSIRNIKSGLFSAGPWGRSILTVNGRDLSLNDVESGIVRPVWKEPRIHYIFNCAAIGCPNLGREAYRGATIDAQMTAAARAYVNDPRGAMIDDDGDLIVSKIFSWYRADFGGSEAAVAEELRRHAAPALLTGLEGRNDIDGYRYDWALNDAATAPEAP